MHEHSLVNALLEQVEELRQQHTAARVKAVFVNVGEFSGVELDLFKSAFEALAPSIWPYPVHLELTPVSLTILCHRCDKRSKLQGYKFTCPNCGSRSVSIDQGDSLVLDHVQLISAELGL